MPRKVPSQSERLIGFFVNAPIGEVETVLASGTAILKARRGAIPAAPAKGGKKKGPGAAAAGAQDPGLTSQVGN